MMATTSVPTIKKLEDAVVNRIAAGEVIQRPANALKEMMENSLDAGSTSIAVTIKSGGMKLLQISDNGCGIGKADMKIVCERFTTSKLDKFEDLQSIGTFGFRGEALASISHVAHVTIVTKTKESKCAWKASYSDGVLKGEPRPAAGNVGTVITVEDLFYNVATRRKALSNPAEEHSRIAEVVTKYAIHNSGVAFALKKSGDASTDVKTTANASKRENIRAIYGIALEKDLVEVNIVEDKFKFNLKGFVSSPNYESKKLQLLMFINNRLVDSASIRKSLANVYSSLLPKGSHPFAYLSLTLDSRNVDVNVHPTKHEVHFLHEDSIVEIIEKKLESQLLSSSSARKFAVQSLLPTKTRHEAAPAASADSSAKKKVYDHQLVRTDSKSQKLDAFFDVKKKGEATERTEELAETTSKDAKTLEGLDDLEEVASSSKLVDETEEMEIESKWKEVEIEMDEKEEFNGIEGKRESEEIKVKRLDAENSNPSTDSKETLDDAPDHETIGTDRAPKGGPESSKAPSTNVTSRRMIKLRSIRELRAEAEAQRSSDLTALFTEFVFVGCVNRKRALLQHGTSLYLINVQKTTEELFYQILLRDFGNFSLLRLTTPAPIFDLALLALDLPASGWGPEDGAKDEIAGFVRDLLVSRREMLLDYFSVDIDERGNLTSLPLLLPDFVPCLDHLPIFLLRAAGEVDWEDEKLCFSTFCRQMALFYAFKAPLGGDDADDPEFVDSGAGVKTVPLAPGAWPWRVEHVLFRAVRSGDFAAPAKLETDGSVLHVANLNDLYRVFERC